MARIEDIQDVHAAQRANAEVAANIAEFDENAPATTVDNSQERIESKYFLLLEQVRLFIWTVYFKVVEGLVSLFCPVDCDMQAMPLSSF